MKRNIGGLIIILIILSLVFPVLIELFSQIWTTFTPLFGRPFSIILILLLFLAIVNKVRWGK